MKTTLVMCLLMLSACASEFDITTSPNTPTVPTTGVDADIASILADENAYRLGLGQTMLSRGLSCTLYTTTGGDRIQSSIAGHNTLQGLTNVGSFLLNSIIQQPDSPSSEGMNVLPPALRSMYKNMYLLRCMGSIVVTETNYYNFELYSDDASVLYLDGSKLLDNDNAHGITLVSGTKYLRRGVHTIRLDYAQIGGRQALVLRAGGMTIDPKYLVH
jgi:hypothetical protein